jgi:hypothetical protein
VYIAIEHLGSFPVLIGYNLYQYAIFRGKVIGGTRAEG